MSTTETAPAPVKKTLKVKKTVAPVAESAVAAEQVVAAAGTEVSVTEVPQATHKSKTNTQNMDDMLDHIQKTFNIDPVEFKKAIVNFLPSTSRHRKNRKNRNKGGPKKGLSSYLFFMKEQRAVLQKDGKIKFVDLTKKIGELWKGLTPEDKTVYENLALEDKKRFATEQEAYLKSAGAASVPAVEAPVKKTRKPKAAAAPVAEAATAVVA
jgi:hypothetical protein